MRQGREACVRSSREWGIRLIASLALATATFTVDAQTTDPVQSVLDQWRQSGKLKSVGPKTPVPEKLTVEQRAMLTESPNLFPYVDVSVPYRMSRPFWMDERRIISTVTHVGNPETKDRELPRIVILDTETQTLEETPYRGYLECFTPDRMVVYPQIVRWGQNRRALLATNNANYNKVLAGRFGETLKEEEYPGLQDEFNKFTCQRFSWADTPANENYLARPLRDGDGYLGRTRLSPKTIRRQQLALFNQAGNVSAESHVANVWAIGFDAISYNTSTNRYFVASGGQCGDGYKGNAVVYDSITFRSNEGFQNHPVPPLIVNMSDWCAPGTWGRRDTAAGIVYIATFVHDSNRHRPVYNWGLYIHLSGKTHRFFNANARVTTVSPSGCRVFADFDPATYDASPVRNAANARIFNVCEMPKD